VREIRAPAARYSTKDNSGTYVPQQKTCHVILPHNTAMLVMVESAASSVLWPQMGSGELLDKTGPTRKRIYEVDRRKDSIFWGLIKYRELGGLHQRHGISGASRRSQSNLESPANKS
jgi:hypothetical protein